MCCERHSSPKGHFDFSSSMSIRNVKSDLYNSVLWADFFFFSKKLRLSNFHFSSLAFSSSLNKTQNWSLWTYSMLLTSCPSAHIPSLSMVTSLWQFSLLCMSWCSEERSFFLLPYKWGIWSIHPLQLQNKIISSNTILVFSVAVISTFPPFFP